MIKIVLVTNASNNYMSAFKERAYRRDVDVVASATSLASLNKSMSIITKSEVDWIVCSENLSEDETYEHIHKCLRVNRLQSKMFLVLSKEPAENFAIYSGIPYVNPDDVTPDELIDVLLKASEFKKESMSARSSGYESEQEDSYSKSTQKGRDREFKKSTRERSKNMRSLNTPQRDDTIGRAEEKDRLNSGRFNYSPVMVCTASSKGGVGKTTTAIELASSIAARAKSLSRTACVKIGKPYGIKVCLVDFNPSFDTMAEILDCTQNIPRNELPTLNDWFDLYQEKLLQIVPPAVASQMENCINSGQFFDVRPLLEQYPVKFDERDYMDYTIQDEETGLFVIPAIHEALDVSGINPDYISYVLNALHSYFDVVIVDTGNNISNFTMNTIDTVDKTLIICEKSNGAAATVDKFLRTLDDVGVNSDRCYMVLSNAHGQGDDKLSKDYERRFGMKKIADIPYDKNVIKSHETHKFYSITHQKTEYAKTIFQLAHWIYPLWTKLETVEEKPKRKKIFGIF